jgi:hypothetical protein
MMKGEIIVEESIKKTLKWLKDRNLKPYFTKNGKEARELILHLIPRDSMVGLGDSSTVRQIGIIQSLRKRGTRVINPFDPKKKIKDDATHFRFVFRPVIEATLCDVYLTGTNAITQDGRILNIDGVGNRVAGMFWGHPQVILVVGRNKIVKNLDEAFHRVKNVIAPEHLKRRKALSPCTVTGRCHDCIGRNRICAVTTIIENKPLFTEINVIIVNEDLGLGWGRSWPKGRINRIAERHEKFMWSLPEPVIKTLKIKDSWKNLKRRG